MTIARTTTTLLLVSLMAGSVFAVAQTQSSSPFARKTKKAWEQGEQETPSQKNAPNPPATYTPPAAYGQGPAGYPNPYPAQPTLQNQRAVQGQYPTQPQGNRSYKPQNKNTGVPYYPGKKPTNTQPYAQGTKGYSQTHPYPAPTNGQAAPIYSPATGTNPSPSLAGAPYQYPAYPQGTAPSGKIGQVPYQGPYQRGGIGAQSRSAQARASYGQPQKKSWFEKIGLGNVETSFSGRAKIGVAAVDGAARDLSAESIVDLDARGEVSAITNGGLEYGAGLRVRAQRDRHRHGFGGRVGDCPASSPACNGVNIAGQTRAVKGHTGQFYTDGNPDTKETALGLEGAYLFLRSSYGDVLIGRDDGSAYLFSLGAPSLVSVGASNSRVDYTGLDSVKTYNDASGFSEKIAYTSPRLLGDQIGVGVQIGASYAPNARACGVDYCVKKNTTNALDPVGPQIEDVLELGVSLDRKFENGLSVEVTGTYARGSEKSGNAVFDDLSSYSLGMEMKYEDLVFGTSYLRSNNGFAGQGHYTAYDIGLTWKPSKWGMSTSYGYADDDIAKMTARQGVLGLSYDVNDKFRLGTGLQYVNRKVPFVTASGRDHRTEDALALFVEAGITF